MCRNPKGWLLIQTRLNASAKQIKKHWTADLPACSRPKKTGIVKSVIAKMDTIHAERFMYLNQRIEELIAKYPDAHSSVGMLILEQMESIPDLSIQDLADLTCVSKATIVRFAKNLGYDGWKEFRRALSAEIARLQNDQNSLDVNYPFQAGQGDEEIIHSIEQLRIQTLERTTALLDVDMVRRIVNLMVRANRIIVFCVSPHIYSAGLFARKMMTIQKPVTVCAAREMGITARTMNSRDLAIIISYVGNNPDTEPVNNPHLCFALKWGLEGQESIVL